MPKGIKNSNMARKGKKNGFYGKHHSIKMRRKLGRIKLGNKNALGYKHTEIARQKMRKPKSEEHKEKLRQVNLGHIITKETRKKMSKAQKGEKGSNWQGGKSFEEYSQDWTDDLKDSIRKRDNYTCLMCGTHQDEVRHKLHCHHTDYNKRNCSPDNLITLCNSCHMKTNYNRSYWINYFNNKEYE